MDNKKELLKYFMPKDIYVEITDTKNFPKLWKDIYFSENKLIKFKEIFSNFNVFPQLTKYINKNIVDVLFLNVDNKEYLIIKIFNKEANYYSYYGGLNPLLSDLSIVNNINLPKKFNLFYNTFINGFFDIQYRHLGLFPTTFIDCVADDDWEFIDEKIQRKDYYILFDNGNGCYIATNKYNFISFIFYSDMENSNFIDFEKVVDEWICTSLIDI